MNRTDLITCVGVASHVNGQGSSDREYSASLTPPSMDKERRELFGLPPGERDRHGSEALPQHAEGEQLSEITEAESLADRIALAIVCLLFFTAWVYWLHRAGVL